MSYDYLQTIVLVLFEDNIFLFTKLFLYWRSSFYVIFCAKLFSLLVCFSFNFKQKNFTKYIIFLCCPLLWGVIFSAIFHGLFQSSYTLQILNGPLCAASIYCFVHLFFHMGVLIFFCCTSWFWPFVDEQNVESTDRGEEFSLVANILYCMKTS